MGLGIRSVFDWNHACMMTHLWDIARRKDSLWVKWCHMFMSRNRNLRFGPIDASWTWNKLMKLRDKTINYF